MTEINIRNLLTNDLARVIVRICKTPKTTSEIIREVMAKKTSIDRDFYERVVGDVLGSLEALKAIDYSEGKWKTTETVLDVLRKYFGET